MNLIAFRNELQQWKLLSGKFTFLRIAHFFDNRFILTIVLIVFAYSFDNILSIITFSDNDRNNFENVYRFKILSNIAAKTNMF